MAQTFTGTPQDQFRPSPSFGVAGRLFTRLLVFAWLWFWRTNAFTGGDSEQWIRSIDGGAWFQETQPLVFFLVQLVFQLIDWGFGGTARMAFALVSCLAGVAAFDVVTRLFEGTPSRGVRLALVLTAGFTTLFYGHLETYAAPAAALMFHLLCVKRSAENRWPVIAIPLSYTLMVALHLVALFVFPAVIFATLAEAWRRPLQRGQLVAIGGALIAPLLVWTVIRSLGTERSSDSIGYLLYVARTLVSQPSKLLKTVKPALKLQFAFWNAGLIPVLLIQAWPRRRERVVRYWAPYLVLLLGFTAVWGAFRDEADFDLHSFPWIVAALLAAWVYRPHAWSRVALAPILAVNVGLWMARPATFADIPNRGTATLHVCPEALEDGRYVLIDQRLRLKAENRFVPAGAHRFTCFAPDSVARARFVLDKGRAYRLCLGDDGALTFEPLER